MKSKIIGPNDPALDVLQRALEQHPELGLTLEIIPWPQYRATLMDALQAEATPYQAVFVPGHIWLPELASAGYLAEIDTLMAEAPQALVEAYAPADIVPAVAEESRFGEHQYQLPFFTDGHILFYRADVLPLDDTQGVPVVPTRQVRALAAEVHRPPEVYGLALKADVSEIFTDWLPYLWEAGGTIFDAEGRPALDSETNIEALAYYCDLRALCPPQTHTYGNAEIAESLRRGEAALVATWGGQAAPIVLDPANPWREIYKAAVFPVPWNATWGIAIPRNQPREAQAKVLEALLQVLTPAQDQEIIRRAGSPVRQSSYTPAALEAYRWLAAQQAMLQRAKPLPARPELGLFLGGLYEAVHSAFTGQSSPSQALRTAQRQAERLLEEAQSNG